MIVLDTNILIYLISGTLPVEALPKNSVIVCPSIVVIEALGYQDITVAEDKKLRTLIKNNFLVADLDEDVIEAAIAIRQESRIKTPDSIVGATAKTLTATLWTANTKDFESITDLVLHNPMEGIL